MDQAAGRPDPVQPHALRTKQRFLQGLMTAGRLGPQDSVGLIQGFTDPGWRGGQAGPAQKQAGQGLIDRFFYRARGVIDSHAPLMQGMQDIQPEDHLLQGATRHAPDKDAEGRLLKARQYDVNRPGVDDDGAIREREKTALNTAPRQGPLQFPPMPAGFIGNNGGLFYDVNPVFL